MGQMLIFKNDKEMIIFADNEHFKKESTTLYKDRDFKNGYDRIVMEGGSVVITTRFKIS